MLHFSIPISPISYIDIQIDKSVVLIAIVCFCLVLIN